MKEFVVYSLLRLLVFVGVLVVVMGLWILAFGRDSSMLWPLVVAFVVSGLLSMWLLNRPREAFARRVEQRAERAAAKLDEMRTKED